MAGVATERKKKLRKMQSCTRRKPIWIEALSFRLRIITLQSTGLARRLTNLMKLKF